MQTSDRLASHQSRKTWTLAFAGHEERAIHSSYAALRLSSFCGRWHLTAAAISGDASAWWIKGCKRQRMEEIKGKDMCVCVCRVADRGKTPDWLIPLK